MTSCTSGSGSVDKGKEAPKLGQNPLNPPNIGDDISPMLTVDLVPLVKVEVGTSDSPEAPGIRHSG